jgi:hypothetical protein
MLMHAPTGSALDALAAGAVEASVSAEATARIILRLMLVSLAIALTPD